MDDMERQPVSPQEAALDSALDRLLNTPISMRRARVYVPVALGAVGAVMLLGACAAGGNESTTSQPESPTRESEKLIDPDYCSERLRRFDLVPRQIEHDYNQAPEALIQRSIDAGVAYLVRFRDMLKDDETPMNLHSMAQLRLTQAAGNYPIALPNPDTYTIGNYLNTFVSDLEAGKTNILSKPDYDGFLGTVSAFHANEDGTFSRETRIWVSPYIARDRRFVTPSGTIYKSYTDAEVGFLLLHEFGHAMQEEMTMQTLNRKIIEGSLAIKASDVEGYRDAFVQQTQANSEEMNRRFAQMVGLSSGWRVQFNEAQANSLHLLAYFTLTQANAGRPVPGTTFISPTEAQRKYDQESNAGTNYPLYGQFLESVMARRDPFEKEWLTLHAIKM